MNGIAEQQPHRRSVAVLFADLSGFTRLVESSEPEIVYEVVRPLMDDLVRLVHHHGGDIQQVLGDGFMAVFGLAVPTGDVTAAALRAGLAMITEGDATPGRLPVHVGIEYGPVLVTPHWEGAGFRVWGRPVNLAKRLCDLAGPGQLHLGPAAYALAGDHPGIAKPVRTRLQGIPRRVVSHRFHPVGVGQPADS